MDLVNHLRAATEDDVALALDRAMIAPPLTTPAELLEFFNRMVDVLTGEDDASEIGGTRIIPTGIRCKITGTRDI